MDLAIKLVVKRSVCIIMVGLKNKMHESVFIIKIFIYSAKKNSAKGPAEYSTLNPETSSDSPSVRSNGARFVSAKVDTNHIIASGHRGRINQVFSCVMMRVCIVKVPVSIIIANKIMPRVTSYEIVCATARNDPIKAYFELDAQPDHKIV